MDKFSYNLYHIKTYAGYIKPSLISFCVLSINKTKKIHSLAKTL